jgi:mannosyltransferase OCH1-like enzyme
MQIRWMKEAYKHRKYAFVADYARFYALHSEGGVYMDTDMLLVKPIEEFLHDEMFIGREDRYNASMGIIAMKMGNVLCRQIMDYYDQTPFDLVHPPIITRFLTPVLQQYGLIEEDTTQHLSNGLVVYQSDYFYPIHYSQDFDLKDVYSYQKPNTHGIHLWNKSWTDEFKLFEAGEYKLGFTEVKKRFMRTPFLPLTYWKKVIKYTGRYLGLWKR